MLHRMLCCSTILCTTFKLSQLLKQLAYRTHPICLPPFRQLRLPLLNIDLTLQAQLLALLVLNHFHQHRMYQEAQFQ